MESQNEIETDLDNGSDPLYLLNELTPDEQNKAWIYRSINIINSDYD